MMMMMNLTLKNVKSFRGSEGYGFNASLYLNGKKVAFVMDEGCGGCYRYEWEHRGARDIVESWVKTLPKTEFEDVGTVETDLDIVMGRLLDRHDVQKQCKTKIMFRVRDGKQDKTYAIKGQWLGHEDHWREYLKRDCERRGQTLLQILNEDQ
jgi:hypothetical protein